MNKDKGLKYDANKAQLDLLPPSSLEAIALVLGFGAKKYGRGNFAKGIEWSRLLSAALRHLGQFNSGEDADSESGLSHIAHAGCMIMFLLYMIKHRPDLDDRWIKQIKGIEFDPMTGLVKGHEYASFEEMMK